MDSAEYCVNFTPSYDKLQAKLSCFRQIYIKLYTSVRMCTVHFRIYRSAKGQGVAVGAASSVATGSGVASGTGT